MVTRLYLIRHGETEGADTKQYKGHIDVPLSENGIKQMKRVASFITDRVMGHGSWRKKILPLAPCPLPLGAVYCSDLTRAVKSAEIIARPHVLKPIILPEL